MAIRIKKKANNEPRWKQNKVSARKKTVKSVKSGRSGRAGRSGSFGKKMKLGRYIFGLIILGLCYQFAVVPVMERILSHRIFNIAGVDVNGAEYIDSEEILNAAAIEIGMNIFEVDLRQVSETLENQFTAEDFTIYKRLPNSIRIHVNEKTPVALLNVKELIGVDKNGVPLPHVGAELAENLPILTGISTVASLSDSTVTERLKAGLALLEKIKDKAPSTYKRISEINVSNMNTLGISLIDNGLEVIIGEKDWIRKIPVLDKVINEITMNRKAVKAVDIRFGEKIVVVK
ncbi:cell division protein FtsQ/DivIB [Candidatus Latescibacterota bacterium]